ncbi:PREDICTED: multidrug resistance-associated protein 4-like [Branchiostoma belcheri]|uniref:Multidrug resistance-associated protein 4-like n=1 Tax=Branchiostoma belcheri TaxID=7741 RepID=A0A6P4Y1L6_BRABE|nr:PREDICTED: multidrug resistance-associated protein 4-like [Branchiostoma belcheri]
MDDRVRKPKPNPLATAGLVSKIFFWWLNPLFTTGYKRTLQEDDMYNVLYDDSSQIQTECLQREWKKELDKEKESPNRPPSLRRALFRVFGAKYLTFGLCVLLDVAITATQPIVLGWLIDYFSPESTVTTTQAYLYALVISVCALAVPLIKHPYMFALMALGWKMRVACCGLIYRKTLKLNQAALGKSNTGQIVNLMSNDVKRFDQGFLFFHYLWIGPLEILIVTILLWRDLGPSCLAGLGYLLVHLALSSVVGKVIAKYRSQIAQKTDDRIRTMSEIISAMRVIKMYTWEKPFSEIVANLRKLEIRVITKAAMCNGLNMTFSSVSIRMIVFFTFVTFTLTGNQLTAGVIFRSIGLYNILQLAVMTFIPFAITNVSESLVSMKRIQKFLLLEDVDCPETTTNRKSSISVTCPQDAGCSILLNKVTAKWEGDSDQLTLKNINLKLGPGQLLAVIGPVGSGKSSLLSAMLQEMPALSGQVTVRGKIGYASQQPWVFSGTVRQNILFGRPYDEHAYEKTIQICALVKDLKLLPHGDMTLVGDKGVTLSGGQKARINLARAVYHDADVYLLDDPLSAVDTHVGRHLFDRCIQGALRNKPRILVTHQLQYLQEADQIMMLLEGEQVATGTYSELLRSGIDFAKMLGTEKDKEEDGEKMDIPNDRGSSSGQRLSQTLSDSDDSLHVEDDKEDVTVPLLVEEDRMTGTVGWNVYRDYFKAGVGVLGCLFAVVMNVGYRVVYIMADWWLAYWARKEEQHIVAKHNWINTTDGDNTTFSNGSSLSALGNMLVTNSSTVFPVAPPDTLFYVYILTAFTAGTLVLGLVVTWQLFFLTIQSSKNLHNDMFNAIIRAPIRFFDTNPVGRVLNRFTKDVGMLDEMFPWTFTDFTKSGLSIVGTIILVGIINPWVFIPTLPLLLFFLYIRKYYLSTSRDIKRLEGTTRSPVFSHLSATLQGLWTIRAFGAQESFKQEFDAHQDLHSEAWFLYLACARWVSVRLDFLAALFVTAVAFCSVLASEGLAGGLVGLSVTYAIILTGRFQWAVRQSAVVENLMTSAERVVTYTKLGPEAPLETSTKPPRDWPQHGRIELEAASFSYSEDGPDILKNLCFRTRRQEKIGIVGRTGAGKSSLMQMLFRMAEPQGTVRIDGVDVTKIGLHDLRKKISVIPQDPVLFSGSLRRNLDPFNDFTDQQLWSALEEVQLKQAVNDLQGKLESEMAESGTNFSVGQRQLVCLARALLRKNRILIIDEATANVDPRTDQLIQETIREKFKNCTVLTIAHRLNSVIDSDRIMVLQEGRVQEMGEAHALLQDRDGVFTAMVDQSGKMLAAELREAARQCYMEKHGTDDVVEDRYMSNVEFLTSV